MPIQDLHTTTERGAGRPDRLLQQALHAGEASDDGWRVRADGSEFYADVRYAALQDDDSDVNGYALIVRDMAEQRRQQRRTERFVEESEDVVTIIDPDGTVTYASGSAERVFGYDPDAIVGENLFDYLHPDGREHAMETFFSCVEESESVTAECRLKSPDGGWFNIEGRCRNMLDDDAIEGILVYLRDVTEKKERARRFEGIFNQTFQFTGLLEPDGTVVEINDAALDFGGFDREEVIGNPFFEARWWTHSEAVYDEVQSAIKRAASGEFVRYKTEVRGGDGLATIDFSVKPVINEDGNASLLVVEGRDITGIEERKQRLEVGEQRLEVLNRVLRHNLRNDAAVIINYAGMLPELVEDPDVELASDKIVTMGRGLTELGTKAIKIEQAFQSAEDGLQPVDLEPIVDETVEELRADHDVEISVSMPDSAEVLALSTIAMAVEVICANAVDHNTSPEPTVEISVDSDSEETEASTETDEQLRLTVADNGPGIPEQEINVLNTGQETALEHGSGLGLWLVYWLAEKSEADLQFDDSDLGGSAVSLVFKTPAAADERLGNETQRTVS